MRHKRFLIVFVAAGLTCLTSYALADWGASQRLTWTSGASYSPAIAADSSNRIHVVWYDSTPGNAEIYYKRSTDGGTTWGASRRLTWTSGGSYGPAIAADSSNRIHVVWYDSTPGNVEIYYKRSTDGGTTWGASQRLTWTPDTSEDPAIAADSSNRIHVFWHDYTPGNAEIYYKRSTDGGGTWSAARRLTWAPGSSENPALSVDSSNRIHGVWEESSGDLSYKRSTDGGGTWSAARRLTWTWGSTYPTLAAGSGNALHLAWQVYSPGNEEVYYKRSTDAGTTWGAARRLTWTSANSISPALGARNTAHLVWTVTVGAETYYKRSTDGGATWSAAERITWSGAGSLEPAIAVDSSNRIHVVWRAYIPGYDNEIYYKRGT